MRAIVSFPDPSAGRFTGSDPRWGCLGLGINAINPVWISSSNSLEAISTGCLGLGTQTIPAWISSLEVVCAGIVRSGNETK